MQHNIEYYSYDFGDTKVVLFSGHYPIKPFLIVADQFLGKRIIPFEFCTQYLDRFRHQKKLGDVCVKFKEVSTNYAGTITQKATLQSFLAELPQPLQDSAFPQLGADQTYIHLAVNF